MEKIKLTKRNYLGEGYVNIFQNLTTGEKTIIPTTKEFYESIPNLTEDQLPKMEGCVWYAEGGTIAVDTPNSKLGDKEYCEYQGGYRVVVLTLTIRGTQELFDYDVPLESIVDDGISLEYLK